MAEWLFEAAGEGGTASPRQAWDLQHGTVSVVSGREPVVIAFDNPDFDLLRAARDKNGNWFPGAFSYSPNDGGALERPHQPVPLSVGFDELPRLARPGAGYFSNPQFEAVPGNDVAFAGEPALSLLCDFAGGKVFRWTARRRWSAPLSIPAQNAAAPLRRPVSTADGFVYATGDRAVAVVHPGSASWQRTSLSPPGAVPVTRPVSTARGALLLARVGDNLCVLEWTLEKDWTKTDLPAEGIGETGEFGGVAAAQGGLVGLCGQRPFLITADRRFVWREMPGGFLPASDATPFFTMGGVYFVGTAATSGRGAWASLANGRGVADLLTVEMPFSPVQDGFVGEAGWFAQPVPGATSGYRLPPGWAGIPLLKFDDAILFLGIDAGMLWSDAIARSRRRWTTRLILSGADGTVRELFESRLDRLSRVQACMVGNAVAVVGLQEGEALLFENSSAAERT